jgi:formate hydrogenlyase subunit 4
MFTIGSFLLIVAIFWFIELHQRADPDDIETNTKHARQDLRLIAYILAAILFMLGIVADRIH